MSWSFEHEGEKDEVWAKLAEDLHKSLEYGNKHVSNVGVALDSIFALFKGGVHVKTYGHINDELGQGNAVIEINSIQ